MAVSLQQYTWSDVDAGLNGILKERNIKQRETSTVLAINIGEFLPENVIVEILSWLPVKELLQFKSVCKSWYAIISSLDFVYKHLENYYWNKEINDGCLLVQYYVSHAELQLFELLLDDTPRVIADEVLYDMPMYCSYICGPCDGLYYLYNYHDEERALWNPAINELKVLPPIITKPDLPSNLTYNKMETYGFGYDSVMDDYKVVVLRSYHISWSEVGTNVRRPQSVFVYSLRTDSWRYCGDLARQYYNLEHNKSYMFLNGRYYWLGSSDQDISSEWVIVFDMCNDTVQELAVPFYAWPGFKSLAIHDYHSLAVLYIERYLENYVNVLTWYMKYEIGPFSAVQRPIGHWNDKFILESENNELSFWDPETQEIKKLGIQRGCRCQGVFEYRESLLSIKKWCESNKKAEKDE